MHSSTGLGFVSLFFDFFEAILGLTFGFVLAILGLGQEGGFPF